jgi:undecaprenyl diphosphate synthase
MKEKIPNHVAIIPDGNRRWARSRGMKPWKGHDAGAQNIENLTRFALKRGVNSLSFWGSSLENLKKRPLLERKELLRIYEIYFNKLITSSDIHDNQVRINVIGKWQQQFPSRLKKILLEGIEKTRKYTKKNLNFFLAYNGDDEMIEAIKSIVESGKKAKDITNKMIKEHLMTRELPAVDFLIRTGGEPHLSAGFMMWDVADCQLYFSEKNFPDFDEKEFGKALDDYAQRGRRMGS